VTSPLKAVAAPGLPNHLFIVDQPGILWVVNLTTTPPTRTRFLDISPTSAMPLVIQVGVCGPDTFDERGLLGVAFHPRYQENGKFYTYTSEPDTGLATIPKAVPFDPDHQNVIREWVVSNPGNPAAPVIVSNRELMRVDWPQCNHGDLAFGPRDGKLYISMGDGGSADDADTVTPTFIVAEPKFTQTPDCEVLAPVTGHQGDGNAQKLNTALGKILRIDVDGTPTQGKAYRVPPDNPFPKGLVPEIWAYGFRNPYRISFDKEEKKDLYLGDVGQNDIEEVDIVKRGGNHGWNCKEGTLFFHINGDAEGFANRERDDSRPQCRPSANHFIDPIAQYDTHHEGHSVIGGYVYHGRKAPSLRGKYVFGDFARVFKFPRGPHDYGRLLAIRAGEGHGLRSIRELIVLPSGDLALAILGIGQDAAGEIYAMGNVFGVPFGNTGVLVRLVEAPSVDVEDEEDDRRDKDDRGDKHRD